MAAGIAFYCSTKAVHHYFDYTYRVALAFLHGHVSLWGPPIGTLNELVPAGGNLYYSVFPLGAVLVNLPFAFLEKVGLIRDWPAHELASLLAAGCVYFFYRLSYVAEMSRSRRILLALFPIFATWAWCNLGLAGAWQIALGFALMGEAASLYYTFVRRDPLLAGVWFAVALGNRTEVLLTAPIYLYYFWRAQVSDDKTNDRTYWHRLAIDFGKFIAFPALLLLCTAAYNWARFGSPFDFGYARIPGLLKEPWYQYGLFSLHYIRWNSYEMLFRGWIDLQQFPYMQPHAFGCSIFLASPFLFLLFREGGAHKAACWIAIAVLTLFLWCHGNAGGWQFSYRYGMVLLPWMFVLIAENGRPTITATEASLFLVSIALSAVATWEFLWTNMIHP